jgi:L-ascorbate metabolism protein UlaG (beta-lactamase superfamily)
MPRLRLVRHATLLVTFEETTFLVDPMLAEAGAMPPIPNSPNDRRNPLPDRPDIEHTHDAVVVNSGAAQFTEGDPITMDTDAVAAARAAVSDSVPVIPDHMDSINHCLLMREKLRAAVDGVTIPEDGETLEF